MVSRDPRDRARRLQHAVTSSDASLDDPAVAHALGAREWHTTLCKKALWRVVHPTARWWDSLRRQTTAVWTIKNPARGRGFADRHDGRGAASRSSTRDRCRGGGRRHGRRSLLELHQAPARLAA